MDRMSKTTGNKLVTAVQEVIEKVASGASPTEALYKVSKSRDHNKEEIKRIAESYNQSRTAFTLQEKEARLNSFPLANADSVIVRLFPENVPSLSEKMHKESTQQWYTHAAQNLKTAVENYNERKKLDALHSEKVASDETPDQWTIQKQSELNKQAELREKFEEAVRQEKIAKNTLTVALFPIKDMLRQRLTGTPFHTIESNLTHYYQKEAGVDIKPIMDLIFTTAALDKVGHRRATPADFDLSSYTLSDFSGAGYMTTENLVKKALDFQKTVATRSRTENALEEVNEKIASFEKKDRDFSDFFKVRPLDKEAAFPISKTIFGRGILSNAGGYRSKNRARTEQETLAVLDDIEDPIAERRRQQIRSQIMLNEFMTKDEVLSSYDPEEITEAYNEIINIAPNVARSRTAMHAALSNYLASGGIHAMEISQLQDLDKGFAGSSRSDKVKDLSSSNEGNLIQTSIGRGNYDGSK